MTRKKNEGFESSVQVKNHRKRMFLPPTPQVEVREQLSFESQWAGRRVEEKTRDDVKKDENYLPYAGGATKNGLTPDMQL